MKDKETKIKLEELIRLKRSEKPTVSEWKAFDEQLKRKLMLSLIKPKPFYARWAAVAFSHPRLAPVGAAAILFAGVLATPLYLSFVHDNSSLTSASNQALALNLPNVASSFATNEISVGNADNHINADISSHHTSLVTYVSAEAHSSLSSF